MGNRLAVQRLCSATVQAFSPRGIVGIVGIVAWYLLRWCAVFVDGVFKVEPFKLSPQNDLKINKR